MAFEPRVVGFLCNWCSYAGADLAGVSRFQYPPNIRIVRVMCSGRVDPLLIVEALIQGADGVFIGGCHPGDCHYINGNLQASYKIGLTEKILELAGIDPRRVQLEWVSASEGQRFADLVRDFTGVLQKLGPSNAGERMDGLLAVRDALSNFRLRALVSNELKIVEEGNAYGEKLDKEKLLDIVYNATKEEFERSMILLLAKKNNMSVKDLSKKTNVPTHRVLEHIVALRQKNLISMDHPEGFTPTYRTIEIGGEQ
ncbi:MAG: hydrogenase iron-sulfur subunit [Candidatus Thermoplasmatota archaeon]|nr:hydrogenase iron-sulfur subunit [Candidatus Thermoplasmatota archaeon]MBU1915417.1 hydrogenase iron-sulfur subunit [Candidatus Thermoplasmatota archaeon]